VYVPRVLLRVLTWNLFHGRAVPPAGRDLFDEFADALAGWEWDVALLQEVPPWWAPALATRLGTDQRHVLTSRNFALGLRRAIATRRPDLIKSNGGGADAILVRGDTIVEHRSRRLCIWPERRWVHAARLHHAATWVANLHAGGPLRDAQRAAAAARAWADPAPLVLGGDFNIRGLTLDGFERAAGHEVDYVFARGLSPPAAAQAEVLDHGRLSDHAPVRVALTSSAAPSPRSPATPSP
jgi:endonuclease/exonuclease/phosphatase family metal-dependent hydrolase